MREGPLRIVVVGGGVAGLTVADYCARPGAQVTVLEASERLGGCVTRAEVAGIAVDTGAESFATRGGIVAGLLDDLGLSDAVVQPNPAGAWLRLADRTVPAPKTGLLGIPGSPLASDVIAAIGWRGALRAYLDRFRPVLTIGTEASLGRLVRARMGDAVLERLVAPVATGVYSAAPEELDLDVVAPGLNAALTRQGSLSGAVSELRSAAKAGSAVAGIDGGMSRLVDALAEHAAERGVEVRTGSPVERIERIAEADTDEDVLADERADAQDAWTVTTADGHRWPADVVVVATHAEPALDLLGAVSTALADASDLDWPTASSVDIVTLVVDADGLNAAPRGTGVLVAPDAVPTASGSGVRAKAMTHSTAKWPWLAAAAEGKHVLRLSYGTAGDSGAAGLTDEQLAAVAVRDAADLLDIPLVESDVVGALRTRWSTVPFAAIGQRQRIRRVRAAAEEVGSLEVVGSWVSGTGLASVVRDAREAAKRILGLRWKASS